MSNDFGFLAFRTDKYHISAGEMMKRIVTDTGWTLLYYPYMNTVIDNDDKRLILLGDIILPSSLPKVAGKTSTADKCPGNYYSITITEREILFASGFMSCYPIYYSVEGDIVTSRISYIKKIDNYTITIDRQFIAESLLLNHSFTTRTIVENIKLLQSNALLEVSSGRLEIKKGTPFYDYFSSEPLSMAAAKRDVIDCFIETCNNYSGSGVPVVTLTSGFDGRTVLSCLEARGKSAITYSFGRSENNDVTFPAGYKNEYVLKYCHIDLGTENYINEKYPLYARDFVLSSSGGNGFLYSHVPFSSAEVSPLSDVSLTGYFGSELLRSVHIPGAVTSPLLFFLFSGAGKECLVKEILSNPAISFIEGFGKTEAELMAEELFSYINEIPSELTENQKIYHYIFNETARKIFGAWIFSQASWQKVRSPFMDEAFISVLLKTRYAGVYNDFRTANPFNRRKGQLLYADILKETGTDLYYLMTGKGYSPSQLHSLTGNMKIALQWFHKKTKQNKTGNYDNLGIISGIKRDREHQELKLADGFFDPEKVTEGLRSLSPFMPERERDSLLMVFSLDYLIKNII